MKHTYKIPPRFPIAQSLSQDLIFIHVSRFNKDCVMLIVFSVIRLKSSHQSVRWLCPVTKTLQQILLNSMIRNPKTQQINNTKSKKD